MKWLLAACQSLILLQGAAAHAQDVAGDAAFSSGDYAAAYLAWRGSADAGDASAMSAVGALYDTGHGVPQDFSAALGWYRRAAEAGDVHAMFSVGAMYDNGRGTPVNRLEATRWYGMAAAKGNGRAAYDLGTIYRDGDGMPQDRAASIRYFKLALAAGIKAARPNLAALGSAPPHVKAEAGPPAPAPRRPQPGEASSRVAAVARFQQAALARNWTGPDSVAALAPLIPALVEQASQGNNLAQYDLGYAFEHGVGEPPDLVKSYVFYLRAAASHEDRVKKAALLGAQQVGSRLSAEQHGTARAMLLNPDE